jgi:hypothetical protein
LNVGLDAVKFELPKGVLQYQLQSFPHQPAAGVRSECVVANRGILKAVADDIV